MRIGSQDGTDWRLQMQAMQAARGLQRTQETNAQAAGATNADSLQPTGSQGSGWGAWQRLSSDDASLVHMMDANGQGRRMTLQAQGSDDAELESRIAEMETRMEQMRTDMQALADTDVGTLSDDEVKSTLSTLIADRIATAPPRGGRAASAYGADMATEAETVANGTSTAASTAAEKAAELVGSMDATEMRELLSKIQEHAAAQAENEANGDGSMQAAAFMQGMPPPPPPGGMNPFGDAAEAESQYGGVSGTQLGLAALSTDSSDLSDSVAAIMEQLMSAWQNSLAAAETTSASDTSDSASADESAGTLGIQDYVTQLKSSLTDLFTTQRERLDAFSNLLFTQLDLWSAGQTTVSSDEQAASESAAATSASTL